ncbi:hypothetical protein N8778_02970 [Verrucomicrobia bacterium]|nr:hypothetical protein [Verrucomicrobiota bacterium]
MMNHYSIIQQAAVRAQMLVGGLGQIGGSYFDPLDTTPLSFRDFRANKYLDRIREEHAPVVTRLEYEMDDFQEETFKRYHEEVLRTLELIKQYQPHLKLFHVKADVYRTIKGREKIVDQTDIWRLKAPDGYSMDYELCQNETGLNKIAHVKFVIQPQAAKQGSGQRMLRHVKECSQVLFKGGVFYLYGWARRLNQYAVASSRHGKNWREKLIQIKDNSGQLSEPMIRLLALYLRSGWVLAGQTKEDDEEIMFLSSSAIKMMFDEMPEQAAENFKYFKDYEKIISEYKIR